VPYQGRWVTPGEQQALLAERVAAAEEARAEAETYARVRETDARVREAEAQARLAEASARLAESDARRAESAEVGIFPGGLGLLAIHPGPLGFSHGFNPAFGTRFHHRRFVAGGHRSRRFVVWPQTFMGALPLAGSGGAFIASQGRPNPAIRPNSAVRR
jgi:hypothetical protein